MSVIHRLSLAAAGLVCLVTLVSVPAMAQGRNERPNADTPRLLIATFRTAGTDARVGVEGAEALRARVQREFSARDLLVIPRDRMNSYLIQSGYPADSALGLEDLKLLAQNFRADAIVDGVVSKTPTGVAVTARVVLPFNLGLVQPLPVVEAPTLADAAKELERHLAEAQRSLLDFRKCSNALATQKYGEAQAAALQGIANYPSSTLSRLCLMDAYSREQQPLDSIIRAADAVLRIDPTSVLALMNLVSAYREKHDTANTLDAMRRLVVYRPDLRSDLVQLLAKMNRRKEALLIVAEMLRETPGDATVLKQRWLLLLADQQWKEALRAGAELVRADTSTANGDYFTRSIAAALSDGQPLTAVEEATRAVAKFPNDAGLWVMAAQAQRKAGRYADALSSVRRALAVDTKVENGWSLLISIQIQNAQLDSAILSARSALAAGADSASIRSILAVPMALAAKHADSSKTRQDWLAVVSLAARIDSAAPSADAKYFLALGAFQVGADVLRTINEKQSCAEATLADEMWSIASINAPLGARAGAEQQQGAAQMLAIIQQYSDQIAKAKATLCRKRR
ncbi:MAG TPA: tetratricopeptide repeat protein [Gemmatimonadaceae bacterium]|nr:tetratricopeptide repeat protein [Gemmatimonadaceae bacterium]